LTAVEYRKGPDGHYHVALQIEIKKGEYFHNSRVLVDTGADKCMIPRELNERFLHLAIAGVDHDVSTASGETDIEWVLIPKMTLMRKALVHAGPDFYRYDLEKTDLSQENVAAWLGDSCIVGMNFTGKFDVRMTKDNRIIFEG